MKPIVIALLVLIAGTASAEIYRWKDSGGTVHYTNLPDTIPQKYRNTAKVLPNMPGEQKKDQPASLGQQGASPSIPLPLPPPSASPNVPGDSRAKPETTRSRRIPRDE
ncbi:DUF4124 domain-containing protein [Geobacter sp. DSM 9736]|uniref:DUF4124 domain-containing protein n=1 Tax=Geobacter sp. DSM 9736 TaxID=1277350 RepID=UPI000B5EFADC|nr:DUF4124 domain-containing protein [Geobacter sp. DSM 9736]SNB46557.1 protein of unknown function [Geobacter sp. DSM 9736]